MQYHFRIWVVWKTNGNKYIGEENQNLKYHQTGIELIFFSPPTLSWLGVKYSQKPQTMSWV